MSSLEAKLFTDEVEEFAQEHVVDGLVWNLLGGWTGATTTQEHAQLCRPLLPLSNVGQRVWTLLKDCVTMLSTRWKR